MPEICILSKTGRGWWEKDLSEMIESKEINKIRFILMDPHGTSINILDKIQKKEWRPKSANIKDQVISLCNYLKSNYGEIIDLKVTDFFYPWTLLLITPSKNSDQKVIYVQLESLKADSDDRPTFKLTQDKEYYNYFLDIFNNIWMTAKTWEIVKAEK